MVAREVKPARKAVHLKRHARLDGGVDGAFEIERVLGAVADDAARRMAEAARGRVPHRVRDAGGQLPALRALAGVQRDLHPVELGQHVVGEVKRAVREDVALDSAQHAERRELLVHLCDLGGLAADAVGVEPGTTLTLVVWSQAAT